MATKYDPGAARAKGEKQYALVKADKDLLKLIDMTPDKASDAKSAPLDTKVRAAVVKLDKQEKSLKAKLAKLTDSTTDKLKKREKEIDKALAKSKATLTEGADTTMDADELIDELEMAVGVGDIKKASAIDLIISLKLNSAPNTKETRAVGKRYIKVRHKLMRLKVTDTLKRGMKTFGAYGVGLFNKLPPGLKGGLRKAGDWMGEKGAALKEGAADMARLPFKAGSYVVDRIKAAGGAMGDLGRRYKEKRGETQGILGWLNKKLDGMQGFVKKMYRGATGSVGGMMDTMAIGFLVSQMLGPFLTSIDKFFTDNFGEHYIKDFFASALSSAWDFVKNGIMSLAGAAKDILIGVKDGVVSEFSKAGSAYADSEGNASLYMDNSSSSGNLNANLSEVNPYMGGTNFGVKNTNSWDDRSATGSVGDTINNSARIVAPPAGSSDAPMEHGPVTATPPAASSNTGGPVSTQGGAPSGGGLGVGMVPSDAGHDGLNLINAGVLL